MPKSFEGFSPKAVTFLRQLKKNNSRDWFTPRKELFEELLRQPMLQLTGMVADQMRGYAIDYVNEPQKAVHRIYRDVRFSKDKSPYKTNISAMFFRKGLTKTVSAGLYFSLSPDGFEIAGGLYMPGPPELAAIRKAITDDATGFAKRLSSPVLIRQMGRCLGEQMSRGPKGFEDYPSATQSLLRRKQFYYLRTFETKIAVGAGLDQKIKKCFVSMMPVMEFMNQILLSASAATDGAARLPQRPEPMF